MCAKKNLNQNHHSGMKPSSSGKFDMSVKKVKKVGSRSSEEIVSKIRSTNTSGFNKRTNNKQKKHKKMMVNKNKEKAAIGDPKKDHPVSNSGQKTEGKEFSKHKKGEPKPDKPANKGKKGPHRKKKSKYDNSLTLTNYSKLAKKFQKSSQDDSSKQTVPSEALQKPKERTPLTDRQKHKLWKLQQKRKAKYLEKKKRKKSQKGTNASETMKVNGSSVTTETADEQKDTPEVPSINEASSNWKSLQSTLHKDSKHESKGRKRKLPPEKMRNPKYRKVEDWRSNNADAAKDTKESAPEIWFDDVDDFLLERGSSNSKTGEVDSDAEDAGSLETDKPNPLVKPAAFKGLTKVVGMDCEMVGVGDGKESILARVSIVNKFGEEIYDKFVKPREEVVDYRTFVSGVTAEDLEKGEDFEVVQKEIASILKGRILVGHAIKNDLEVLFLHHPKKSIRDTSRYKPFRQLFHGKTPSLKKLTAKLLSVSVQEGQHNSVQDAQAAIRLYTMHRQKWESELAQRRFGKGKTKPSKSATAKAGTEAS